MTRLIGGIVHPGGTVSSVAKMARGTYLVRYKDNPDTHECVDTWTIKGSKSTAVATLAARITEDEK